MLKRAAELQGRTMTDFVVAAVQDAAQRAIGQHGTVEKIGVKKGLERRALAGVVRR